MKIEKLKEKCWTEARKRYGCPLPGAIERRLNEEFEKISFGNHWYMIGLVTSISDELRARGHMLFGGGSMCSSLVLSLLQVTASDPVSGYYDDKENNFVPDVFFYGLQGEKRLDLSLNLSGAGLQNLLEMLQQGVFAANIIVVACENYYRLETTGGNISIGISNLADAVEEGRSIEDIPFPKEEKHTARIVQPTDLEELTMVLGLYHGTDIWNNNAEVLLSQGIDIKQLPIFREDIYNYMLLRGFEISDAYAIADNISHGRKKRLDNKLRESMCAQGIPAWYVECMWKVAYLFPRAHIAERISMMMKLADNEPKQIIRAIMQ